MGLSRGQIQSERQRIQEDIVLSKGQQKIVLPTTGGNQEVMCMELEFLPTTLACQDKCQHYQRYYCAEKCYRVSD
jgi:hypothetical protein